MLLRSISKHVKDQNWFAVGLDFFIVVFGVLIAFQITNWNEASRAALKETAILEQLHSEFTEAVDEMRNSKLNTDASIDAGFAVLGVIRDGKEPADKAAFLETLQTAAGLDSGALEPTTLTELLSSGGLSELSSQTVRTALVRYHETAVGQQKIADLVLQRVSAPNEGFHSAVYLNPEFRSDGIFLYKYDWTQLEESRQQFQVLLYGNLGLSRIMEELIVRGEAALLEIDEVQQ